MLDRTTPHEDPTAWRQALLILAAAALLRLALAAVVPLFPDEAYYWEWSRRLAGGYFDHPPGIAWLVRAGTALLGPSPFAVRLAPILVASSGGLAIALAARTLAGDRAARYAALIFSVMPLAAA
ncbi:MAG: glycosyltransferase family 39 protein, partial [Gemmatimonadaceae bacterium]|nr:glycosyltransferase family 39 protein [Gemmatimonadaceae bacterium]